MYKGRASVVENGTDLDGWETGLKHKGHVHDRYVLYAISEPEF
jgi:hypothetical protein